MTCPNCGCANMNRVIYLGLPGRLCPTSGCNTLLGPASYAPAITYLNAEGEIDFHFTRYEGSYLKGLWFWLMEVSQKKRIQHVVRSTIKKRQHAYGMAPDAYIVRDRDGTVEEYFDRQSALQSVQEKTRSHDGDIAMLPAFYNAKAMMKTERECALLEILYDVSRLHGNAIKASRHDQNDEHATARASAFLLVATILARKIDADYDGSKDPLGPFRLLQRMQRIHQTSKKAA